MMKYETPICKFYIAGVSDIINSSPAFDDGIEDDAYAAQWWKCPTKTSRQSKPFKISHNKKTWALSLDRAHVSLLKI